MKKTSLYLDPALDEALARRAAQDGISKAELIRRTLEASLSRPAKPRLLVGAFNSGERGKRYATIDEELRATGFGEIRDRR
jgi:hypothetical protein